MRFDVAVGAGGGGGCADDGASCVMLPRRWGIVGVAPPIRSPDGGGGGGGGVGSRGPRCGVALTGSCVLPRRCGIFGVAPPARMVGAGGGGGGASTVVPWFIPDDLFIVWKLMVLWWEARGYVYLYMVSFFCEEQLTSVLPAQCKSQSFQWLNSPAQIYKRQKTIINL